MKDDEKHEPAEVYDNSRFDSNGDYICCVYGIYLKSRDALFYVGATVDLYRIALQHQSYMSNVTRKDYHRKLYVNMRLNDWDDYEFRILERITYMDTKHLNGRKNYYIKELDPLYNSSRGRHMY